MRWWTRLTPLRRVLLVVLLLALGGTIGALVWDYPVWPFSFVGFGAIVTNFVLTVRGGLDAPIPSSSGDAADPPDAAHTDPGVSRPSER